MAKCAICGKSIPLTLPPYMRVYKDKDGHWKPYKDLCQCNKDMYEFCVLGLVKRQEARHPPVDRTTDKQKVRGDGQENGEK